MTAPRRSKIRAHFGSSIPDCCVVGIGAVVTKPFSSHYSLVAGVFAKVRRPLTIKDHPMIFGKARPDLPEQNYPKPPPA